MWPIVFIVIFTIVMIVLTIRACNDLDYCIKQTFINKARKDAETRKMKEDINWLVRDKK